MHLYADRTGAKLVTFLWHCKKANAIAWCRSSILNFEFELLFYTTICENKCDRLQKKLTFCFWYVTVYGSLKNALLFIAQNVSEKEYSLWLKNRPHSRLYSRLCGLFVSIYLSVLYTLANDVYRTIPHAIRGKLIDMLSGKCAAFWNIVNFYAESWQLRKYMLYYRG